MIWWPNEIATLTHGLVTLRPSNENDIDAIYKACQDPLIPAFTTVPTDYTIDHAIDFVRSDPFSFAERRELRFVIDYGTGSDRKFAGVISLHTINIKNHTAEIGYWMDTNQRGKGIASKILTELEIWCVELGYKKCVLETGKNQPEAIALYKKNQYNIIPNFGKYEGVENSVCFEKEF